MSARLEQQLEQFMNGDHPTSIVAGLHWFGITPSNSGTILHPIRAIYVGGAGNLTLKDHDGGIVQFVGVLAGHIYSLSPQQVMAATTATNLVGIY